MPAMEGAIGNVPADVKDPPPWLRKTVYANSTGIRE